MTETTKTEITTEELTVEEQLYLDFQGLTLDQLLALRRRAEDPNDSEYVTLKHAIANYKGTPEAQSTDFSDFYNSGPEVANPDRWAAGSKMDRFTNETPIKAVTLVVYFDGSIPNDVMEEAVLDITSLEYLSDSTDEYFRMAVGQALPLDGDESVEFYVEDKEDLDEDDALEMDDLREGNSWPVITLRTDIQ